jgi:septum site-determining protein MinD
MSRIICLHSARAGTGKTTITANLAAQLAARGRHVGVIDTDVAMPGMYVLFQMENHVNLRALNSYLWHDTDLENAVYDYTHEAITGSLRCVPASPNIDILKRLWRESYDIELLHRGIDDMIRRYNLDYVLVDTHPGFREEELLTALRGNPLLIVATPDRQVRTGTRYLMDALRRIIDREMFMVLNHLYDATRLPEEFISACKIDLMGHLPYSMGLACFNSEGLFALDHPDDPWSHALDDLAIEIEKHAL